VREYFAFRSLQSTCCMLCLCLILILVLPSYSANQQTSNYSPELIVRFDHQPTVKKDLQNTASFSGRLGESLADFEFAEIKHLGNIGDNPLNIYLLTPRDTNDFVALKDRLRSFDGKLWIEENRQIRIDSQPDDSLFNEQWGLEWTRTTEAWEIMENNSTSVSGMIAVIDTGIDLYHPDLYSSVYVNSGEDLNGNGHFLLDPGSGEIIIDSADLDGIDNDGNGFIDDLSGWDFTDAPGHPAPGDYLHRDAVPQDEHGHGTMVSGICSAIKNNTIGICGIAPGAKILPLKAANSFGWLEVDDVAAAILYAVAAGADVINMSFGDPQASFVLHDVLEYAAANSVSLVSSSGNTGDQSEHYPSAWPFTISVGSASLNGNDIIRSGSSSWGANLDLLAPGNSILTTGLNGGWDIFNGTSAAAPFVSAAVILAKSTSGFADPELLRSRILQASTDINEAGWDAETGTGFLDLATTVGFQSAPHIGWSFPYQSYAFNPQRISDIPLVISAWGDLFSSWSLDIGRGENPDNWVSLATGANPAVADTVAWLRTTQNCTIDGIWSLKLQIDLNDGVQQQRRILINRDSTPPNVLHDEHGYRQLGLNSPYCLNFSLNENCYASLEISQNTNSLVEYSMSRSADKYFAIDLLAAGFLPNEQISLKTEFWNQAGDTTAFTEIQITSAEHFSSSMELSTERLPFSAGTIFEKTLNFQGFEHLLFTAWQDELEHSIAIPAWYSKDEFNTISLAGGYERPFYPVAIKDTDFDGKVELLGTYAGNAFLFEADTIAALPLMQEVNFAGFWGAGLIQPDEQSANAYLLLRDTAPGNVHYLYKRDATGEFRQSFSLSNPWQDENPSMGKAHSKCMDFDDDSLSEIVLSDNAGHIYAYQLNENQTEINLHWQINRDYSGPADNFCLLETVEQSELLALYYIDSPLGGETESAYWRLIKYAFINNGVQAIDSLDFAGVNRSVGQENSIIALNPAGNSQASLVLCLRPQLYILDQDFNLLAAKLGANSDFIYSAVNQQGGSTLMLGWQYDDSQGIVQFEASTQPQEGPPAPDWTQECRPLNENSIYLGWRWPGEVADSVKIFLDQNGTDSLLCELPGWLTGHLDSLLAENTLRRYRLQAVNYIPNQIAGIAGDYISLQSNAPPQILRAQTESISAVRLFLSEVIDQQSLAISNFELVSPQTNRVTPGSAVSAAGGTQILLTIDAAMRDSGIWNLRILELKDLQGTINRDVAIEVEFDIAESGLPLITQGVFLETGQAQIEFHSAMNSSDLQKVDNYSFQPDLTIVDLQVAEDGMSVIIVVNEDYLFGPGFGETVIFTSNLHDVNGILLSGDGSRIVLHESVNDLKAAYVYPNPWRANGIAASGYAQEDVVFSGLSNQCSVRIYDLQGLLIYSKEYANTGGRVAWNLRNRNGRKLKSGVYLYHLANKRGDHQNGKLVVVR
jgi:subtilisin family serine protease